MRRVTGCGVFLALLTIGTSGLSSRTGGIPEGFTPIFNGKDLSGWHPSRTTHQGTTGQAYVEDGAIVLKQQPYGQGGILLTDRRYKDFELYLEARPDWGCNGGILFRSTEGGSAYQIEVDPGRGTGALLGDALRIGKSAGRWASTGSGRTMTGMRSGSRSSGRSPRMALWINGVLMWDVAQDRNDLVAGAVDGMIGLQTHWSAATAPPIAPCCARSWRPGGAHRYRNIAIKERR